MVSVSSSFCGPWSPARLHGLGLVLALMGCASAGGGRSPIQPHIESIVPASGPAGTAYPIEVVLRGTGFAAEGNTIRFGDVILHDLPSTHDGTQIVFMAPKQRVAEAESPPMTLLPGRYPVSVSTPFGTSAPVSFELVRDAMDALK